MHDNPDWIRFSDPVQEIIAETSEKVPACLAEIDKYVNEGYYAAGYLSYEASGGIDLSLKTYNQCGYPVLWFGIYNHYSKYDMSIVEDDNYVLGEWISSISEDKYKRDIATIKNYIKNGDTYQVNHTLRLRNKFSGSPLSLFKKLSHAQASLYSAFIDTGDFTICSASPELFFEFADNKVVSRPMKGTVKRGYSAEHDRQQSDWLHNSPKNRAENIMIVDMIRNDMGRFAETGSVHAEKLFSIERYPTVFQMTSSVSARTDKSVIDIIRHMFPCASITGAPKVRTMEIINELENDPRGIYTGSIGYISPDSKAQFNVAIRTVVIDNQSGNAEYGAGGGIVADSNSQDEYDECKLKAEILTYSEPSFELLETIIWVPDQGFLFLENHIARIKKSAGYFNFAFNEADVIDRLNDAMAGKCARMRVRLTSDRNGHITVTYAGLSSIMGHTVGIVKEKIDCQSEYVYNKTTNRIVYDNAIKQCAGFDDVILINRDGMVTESCIANVVIRKDGLLLTPALECGLLCGVFRSVLLNKGIIKEAAIHEDDLQSALEIYLVNSVRGFMRLVKDNGSGGWIVSSENVFDMF